MINFNNTFPLAHNIKIYIPSTIDVNKQTDNSQYIEEGLKLLSGLFGGCTSYEAKGSWLSNKEGLVIENVTIIESYCKEEDLKKNLDNVLGFCYKLKKELNQEAISLNYDNQLFFI